jgi:hypothetical protein
MPTPASGAISMNDMNVQITRASGTATVSMDTIRTRYGGSGAISFSDLYDTEGFTVTCAAYSSKFVNFEGWSTIFATGSVSPNESNGSVQVAANSYIYQLYSGPGAADGAQMNFGNIPGTLNNANAITAGYRGTDVTRIVTANTSRTITNSSNNGINFTYDAPSSGTIHCLVKF